MNAVPCNYFLSPFAFQKTNGIIGCFTEADIPGENFVLSNGYPDDSAELGALCAGLGLVPRSTLGCN